MFQAFSRALPGLQIEPKYAKAAPQVDGDRNLRHIAKFESRPNPSEVDPMILTVPHGQLLIPKLIENLASDEVVLRLSASNQFPILFNQKEEFVVDCIKYDGVPALLIALEDDDAGVRANVASAIRILSSVWAGHEEIIRLEALPALLRAVTDDDTAVSCHTLHALVNLDSPTDEHAATAKLMDLGSIQTYLDVIERTGFDDTPAALVVVPAVLGLLACCHVKEGFVQVLDNKAAPVLANILRGPVGASHEVTTATARCISELAVFAPSRFVFAAEHIPAALLAHTSALMAHLFDVLEGGDAAGGPEADPATAPIVTAMTALFTAIYAVALETSTRRVLVAEGFVALAAEVLRAGPSPIRPVVLRIVVLLSEDAVGRRDCGTLRGVLQVIAEREEPSVVDVRLARRALQHLDGKRSSIM